MRYEVSWLVENRIIIAELNQYTNARYQTNMGWVVIINDSTLIKFFGNLITQITKTRFRNFATVQEGIDFLQAQDSTIDWSSVTADVDSNA